MIRILFACLVVLSLGACASIERVALPKPNPAPGEWTTAAAQVQQQVNYASFDRFLRNYRVVDTNNIARLRYGSVTPGDRAALEGFITSLETTDVRRLTRNQQLAFWINLYNAQTIRVILENYPVESIRDITDGLFSFGPWDRKDLRVLGRALSLNDIEHRIVRAHFKEPRIHYAFNCAAVGCPNLAAKAWRARGLDAAFDAAERAYLAHPRGLSIEANGRVVASKIFIWFREDFGANEAELRARLIEKLPPEKAAMLQARGRIDRYAYDWSLNEAP